MKKLIFVLSFLLLFTLTFTVFSSLASVLKKSNETNLLQATAKTYENALESAVFFGDSTTYGLLRYNVNNHGEHGENYHTLSASQVWVPKNGTFYLGNLLSTSIALPNGQELSLEQACKKIKPSLMIITVGINGLRTWNEDTFTRYYEKMLSIIKTASPSTEIILQSVYPISQKRSPDLIDFTQDKIDRLNSWIENIAKKHCVRFLNTATILKDNSGHLIEEYHNGDGLHLNTKGFNAVLNYIDTCLSQ